MLRVRVEKSIALPADRVWSVIDDFGAIQKFHPLVRESGLLNHQTTGKGAERYCDFGDGNRIAERIIDYAPGEAMTVAITDTAKFPLEAAEGTLSVEPNGTSRSTASFELRFKPKLGILGWVLGKTVLAGQFRKILSQVLDGLDVYARTGQPVGRHAA